MDMGLDSIITRRTRGARAAEARAAARGTEPYIKLPVDEWKIVVAALDEFRARLAIAIGDGTPPVAGQPLPRATVAALVADVPGMFVKPAPAAPDAD